MRVYADTSVLGGVWDIEFDAASQRFLDLCRAGTFSLVVSTSVRDELEAAPGKVKDVWKGIMPYVELVSVTPEATNLQRAYLNAGVVTPKCDLDALHVAIATVSKCDMIVSWNFRHIVNYRRIPMYNRVNLASGYQAIGIYSPLEVIGDEG